MSGCVSLELTSMRYAGHVAPSEVRRCDITQHVARVLGRSLHVTLLCFVLREPLLIVVRDILRFLRCVSGYVSRYVLRFVSRNVLRYFFTCRYK